LLDQKLKRKAIVLAVASLCECIAIQAYAQQAGEPQKATEPPKTVETQKVTVVGFKGAAEEGLLIKRSSDGFVDAISAEGLGRFPELNVGEALTRIPGIQLDRFGDDRDARVSLRGLPGNFAVVTVNGLGVADPNRDTTGGGTPLGMFSSDLFTRFVVNKSPNASDASGGLSGNIDLQFRGALARKDEASIKVAGEYNSLGKTVSPATTFKFNHHFSQNFAVFGTLAYKKENFRRDEIAVGPPQRLFPAWFPTTAPADNGGVFSGQPRIGTGTDRSGNASAYFTGVTNGANVVNPNAFVNGMRWDNVASFTDYYAPRPSVTNPIQQGEQSLYIPAGSVLGNTSPIEGTGKISRNGVQMLGGAQYTAKESKGENTGLSTGFEYRVNNWRFGVTGLYADKNLSSSRQEQMRQFFPNFDPSPWTLTANPDSLIKTAGGNYYVTEGTVDNMTYSNISTARKARNKAFILSSSAIWERDDWKVTTTGSTSKATGREELRSLEVQSANRALFTRLNSDGSFSTTAADGLYASNGSRAEFALGNGDVNNIRWVSLNPNPIVVPTGNLVTANLAGGNSLRPEFFAQGNTNSSSIRTSSNDGPVSTGAIIPTVAVQSVVNEVNGIQQEFERALNSKAISSVKAGWRAESNNFKMTQVNSSVYGINKAGITQDLAGKVIPQSSNFFGGKVQPNPNWFGTAVDNIDVLKPTAASLVPGQDLTPIGVPVALTEQGWVNNFGNQQVLDNNFTNDYKIYSTYVVANLDTKLWSVPIRGNFGLRHERTEKTIVAMDRDISVFKGIQLVDYKFNTYEKSYSYNLPSFLLAADLRKDLVFRVGAYKTYVRPSRSQERPNTSIVIAETGNGTTSIGETRYAIDAKGSQLNPYTANSYDVALEWYNRKGSLLAIGVYQKDIRGFIYQKNLNNSPQDMCPANGLFSGIDYGHGPLAIEGAGNTIRCRAVNDDPNNSRSFVDEATGNLKPTPVYVTATANANNPNNTRARGFEFNVQQSLDFLPAPWKYLGGSFNYSYTKVNGKLPNGRSVESFLQTAKNNYNLIAYYDQEPFGIRLVYNSRNAYARSPGDTATFNAAQPGYYDLMVKARPQLDLSTSWKFKNGAIIALDVFNLQDSRVETYQEDERLLRSSAYDGRTATLTYRMPL
jgi:TonB-dependent receptor